MLGSIVVKGKLPTLALPSVTALKNVDLPTEGLPTQPITSVCPDMVANERERRVRQGVRSCKVGPRVLDRGCDAPRRVGHLNRELDLISSGLP